MSLPEKLRAQAEAKWARINQMSDLLKKMEAETPVGAEEPEELADFRMFIDRLCDWAQEEEEEADEIETQSGAQ